MRINRTEETPEQLIFTHPGLIALNGMNETGVGVVVNTLLDLNACNDGLPVAFVVRRLIGSTDKDDILNFIQSVKHASGQNYIIGIRGEVYDFEASSNEVVRFDPNNNNGTVYHTNHPIANKDIKDIFKKPKYKIIGLISPRFDGSYFRFRVLKKQISKSSSIDDELIESVLRSKENPKHPICASYEDNPFGFTFGSTIMQLTGQPLLKITAGPPDESDYKTIGFSAQIDTLGKTN
ncbi:MAG: carcinine hydrolase/isopenicillin-N N-acyltransferase family protein [Chitinophagales bacterium]